MQFASSELDPAPSATQFEGQEQAFTRHARPDFMATQFRYVFVIGRTVERRKQNKSESF